MAEQKKYLIVENGRGLQVRICKEDWKKAERENQSTIAFMQDKTPEQQAKIAQFLWRIVSEED